MLIMVLFHGSDYLCLKHFDRLLLGKRAIMEIVNDELKNIARVEHFRHRRFDNLMVNLLGTIAAYCLFQKKPCINVQRGIGHTVRFILNSSRSRYITIFFTL